MCEFLHDVWPRPPLNVVRYDHILFTFLLVHFNKADSVSAGLTNELRVASCCLTCKHLLLFEHTGDCNCKGEWNSKTWQMLCLSHCCSCWFAYWAGKWDVITSCHLRSIWRCIITAGVNLETLSCPLVIGLPSTDVNTSYEQAHSHHSSQLSTIPPHS